MSMGTQFWWFYDAAAAAVILICIYSCGKKGFSKLIALVIGYVLCIAAAFAISDKAAEYIYGNYVKQRDIAAIEQLLDENKLSTENILAEMGIDNLYDNDAAEILMQDSEAKDNALETADRLFSENLPLYIPDSFSEISDQLSSGEIENILNLISGNDNLKVAEYIEENYTGAVARNIIKLICFIISLAVLIIIMKILVNSFGSNKSGNSAGSVLNHTLGGTFGAVEGVFAVFILASAVRVLIAVGNDEMMFFNSSVVEKTYIFRYIYNLTAEL
jgi:uncharacterized membrane protein required for colicin V production